MQPAFVWTSTKNEWNAQNAMRSRAFRPSTPRTLITRVLTICQVQLTQSTTLKQKRVDLRSLSPALPNLWLLLVLQSNLSSPIIWTPLYYGQFVWSQKCQKSYIPYLYNTDTSVKRTLGSVPLLSVLQGFDCTSYVALGIEKVINFIMHKQTLPSSPKRFDVDAGVLIGEKGLFSSFKPEIKPE